MLRRIRHAIIAFCKDEELPPMVESTPLPPTVKYHICYSYSGRMYHNGGAPVAGVGDCMVRVEGGVSEWSHVESIRKLIKTDFVKAHVDVRILSLSEVARIPQP
jgi:hypothetical protein